MDQVIQKVSDFLQTLTWIDYILVLGVARGAFVGFKSGGFVELLRWLVLCLTLAAVVSFSGTFTGFVQDHTLLSEGISRAAVIVVLGFLIFTVLRMLTQLILKFASMDNNWPMKIMGTLLGALRWAVGISFAVFAMNSTQLFTIDKDDLSESRWGSAVQPIAPAIVDFARGAIPEATLGLQRVDADAGSKEAKANSADKKSASSTKKSESKKVKTGQKNTEE